jgi:leukotriene-A4 hydrolase
MGLWKTSTILIGGLSLVCSARSFAGGASDDDPKKPPAATRDWHTQSNPEQVRVTHVALDLTVDFPSKTLGGTATLDFKRQPGCPDGAPLKLDTDGLQIQSVAASAGGKEFGKVHHALGPKDKIRGRALTISIQAGMDRIRIAYRTTPESRALQWLDPSSTAGGKHPFVCTQSQSILARTWIPLQDTPGVRVTYSATIHAPLGLRALMSADAKGRDGQTFRWEMPQPIPSYLIALVVGDLEFRPLGEHTGVYAEPKVLEEAATEFKDTERMFQKAEALFGKYRWGERYDLVVMPPGFPYGGMENPKLTFVTPTIIAGDGSLVSVVAHELSHSWSGNLVTNSTWSGFWINEGFTTFSERRIIEELYGRDRAVMHAQIGLQGLRKELKNAPANDQVLDVDLVDRDPDEMVNSIPYEKGNLFLKTLEHAFGRARFDAFLRGYFDHFAFRSITTAELEQYLRDHLFNTDPKAAATIDVHAWLYEPGLPAGYPEPQSERLAEVDAQARQWIKGTVATKDLEAGRWTTDEWLRFLRGLPENLSTQRMAELDTAFRLSQSRNAEILFAWLFLSIKADYQVAEPRLETFLTTIGRGKFIRPLYKALADKDKKRARGLFDRNQSFYHAVVRDAIARELTKP